MCSAVVVVLVIVRVGGCRVVSGDEVRYDWKGIFKAISLGRNKDNDNSRRGLNDDV